MNIQFNLKYIFKMSKAKNYNKAVDLMRKEGYDIFEHKLDAKNIANNQEKAIKDIVRFIKENKIIFKDGNKLLILVYPDYTLSLVNKKDYPNLKAHKVYKNVYIYEHNLKRGRGIKKHIRDAVGYVKEGYTRVKNALKGSREGPSPNFNKFLDEHGDENIKKIAIARTPVSKGYEKILNKLSGGKYGKTKEKLGYDNVFHNYLLVETDKGEYLLEKNHVIEGRKAKKYDFEKGQVKEIPLDGKQTNMKELISNVKRKDKGFWQYKPETDNCQKFTEEVIKGSDLDKNISDHTTKEIIKPQDGKELIGSLGLFSGIPSSASDLAGRLDRLAYGGSVSNTHKLSVSKLFKLINEI